MGLSGYREGGWYRVSAKIKTDDTGVLHIPAKTLYGIYRSTGAGLSTSCSSDRVWISGTRKIK